MKKRTSPRIIAGKLKGARLKSVPGDITRPITDRAKENLFNIIGSEIYDCDFLDAFGGTGSVGIEAYSRGASFVQIVEKNQKPFRILLENVKKIKDSSCYSLLKYDALLFLRNYRERSFDFVFIAPPQYKDLWKVSLNAINSNEKIVKDTGSIIIQIDPIEYSNICLANFKEVDQRKYGNTLLIFLQKPIR